MVTSVGGKQGGVGMGVESFDVNVNQLTHNGEEWGWVDGKRRWERGERGWGGWVG